MKRCNAANLPSPFAARCSLVRASGERGNGGDFADFLSPLPAGFAAVVALCRRFDVDQGRPARRVTIAAAGASYSFPAAYGAHQVQCHVECRGKHQRQNNQVLTEVHRNFPGCCLLSHPKPHSHLVCQQRAQVGQGGHVTKAERRPAPTVRFTLDHRQCGGALGTECKKHHD
jgi:hypothetical protein